MVYFIQASTLKFIKIGYTTCAASLRRRFSSIQTGSPDKLQIIGIINDVDEEYEAYLHVMFKQHNVRGEWFEPHKDLLQFISENSLPIDKVIKECKTNLNNYVEASKYNPKMEAKLINLGVKPYKIIPTREEMVAKARAGNEKFIGLDHLEYLKARMLQ